MWSPRVLLCGAFGRSRCCESLCAKAQGCADTVFALSSHGMHCRGMSVTAPRCDSCTVARVPQPETSTRCWVKCGKVVGYGVRSRSGAQMKRYVYFRRKKRCGKAPNVCNLTCLTASTSADLYASALLNDTEMRLCVTKLRALDYTGVGRRVGRARLNAPDSKSDIGVSLSGVRIPHSPPSTPHLKRRKLPPGPRRRSRHAQGKATCPHHP